jgi:hypothetical protein
VLLAFGVLVGACRFGAVLCSGVVFCNTEFDGKCRDFVPLFGSQGTMANTHWSVDGSIVLLVSLTAFGLCPFPHDSYAAAVKLLCSVTHP